MSKKILGSNLGYSPSLVGVLGTKLPAVSEYSLIVTTSLTDNGMVIVKVGPSVETTYSYPRVSNRSLTYTHNPK